jgi:hypothetical protein
MKNAFPAAVFALLTALTQASLVCERAQAALGGGESSLEDDRRAISGVMRTATGHDSYTVYEIATPGRLIREYVRLDGKVFGVAWQGVTPPDLKILLGSYYEELGQASKTSRPRAGARRAHSSIQGPNSVLERSGHMRDLRGRAYVEALRPENVSIDEIQ